MTTNMRHRVLRATRLGTLVATLTLGIVSCREFLDVNQDPNSAERAVIDIRLAALITTFVHSTYYGENSLWGSEWTQQFSFNRDRRSYAQVHRYEISETSATTAWNYFYTRPTHEAFQMVNDASAEADIYYRGIAKLFYGWSFQIISDLWGPVPYEESFNTSIREPKYDEQKVVYEGILKNFEEAAADLSSATGRRPTTNDLLYAGDVTKWAKLAKFLQARTHLRLAYAPGENKTDRANKALAALTGGLASNADDAAFTYPGGTSARNPNYTFVELRGTFVAAEYLVELLKARQDPRIGIFFTPAPLDSVRGTVRYPATSVKYVGHRNGAATLNDSTVSWIGPVYSAETATLDLVSYADQKFTEAEARFIVSGATAADAPYRDGVRAHMQKVGVSAAAINTYLAALPALSTRSNPLEEIITQKYIANFLKVEPWNDWRRTGYPVLPSPVEQAMLPGIPQRIRTPGSELSSNINQVTATGIPTGLEGMSVKVWWASGAR
jgi:SusD/RagB-like outer membrane lipoprotein